MACVSQGVSSSRVAGRLAAHAVVGLSPPVERGARSLLPPCRPLDKMRSVLVLWIAGVDLRFVRQLASEANDLAGMA